MLGRVLLCIWIFAFILYEVLGAESFGRIVVQVLLIPLAGAVAILPAWWIGAWAARRTSLRRTVDTDKNSEPSKMMAPYIAGVLTGVPVFLMTTAIVWLTLGYWV